MRPIFTERGPGLDRFGVLLIATVVAVSLQSLVDMRDPQGNVVQFFALLATSTIAAGSLLLATRASGVARRLRLPITVVVLVGITASLVTYLVGGDPTKNAELAPPPLLIVFLSLTSPVLVCHRLARHRVVTVRTILGAIAAYLLIAVALFYVLLTMEWLLDDPVFGSVQPTTSFMYFSLTTITTLGYGDLAAVPEPARFVSVAVAVVGQVFLVVFVAMIVARFDPGAGDDATAPDDAPADD